jgi:hypothetical protein
MSRKSRVPWYEADEPQEAKPKANKENDEGAPVAFGDGRDADQEGGNGIGLYYCGRDLGEDAIPGSDGHCGPYGGPQCASCKRFQAQEESRHDVGSDLQNLFNLPGANTRVLQDRVKAKVQQILAGRDLSNTTIGKLRSALEEKLGVPVDSLQSTRRLRKFIVQVLEHEVLKKSQRTRKCERICRALADMETYPDNCRRMLIEALPSAMACPEGLDCRGGEPPHPHQVRMLETVQMVLQESLDHVRVECDNSEIHLQSEQAKLKELEEAQQVSADAAAKTMAEFENQEKVLSRAQEACEDAKSEVASAKDVKLKAIESRESLLKEQERFKAVHASFIELLEEESLSQESRLAKLEEVRQGLQFIGTEASLVTAALAALQQSKSSRSKFEEVSAKAVGRVFAEKSSKYEQDLVQNAVAQEDSPIEAAEILHDAMLQNAASKNASLSALREALDKSEGLFKAAKKEAKQQENLAAACQAKRDALHEKSAELSEVLVIVQQLTVSTDPPSPGPSRQGGTAAALADDAAEDESQVAASLGNDLVAAADDARPVEEVPVGAESEEAVVEAAVGSCATVDPANLEGAFEAAAAEQAAESENAPSAEPPAKRQKLDDEAAPVDEPMASCAPADPVDDQLSSSPIKELAEESSIDLRSVMMTGGA